MVKKFGAKCKQVVRDHVAGLITNKMTIFSLPYLNFAIESKAKRAVCVEREEYIYKEQLKIAPKNCEIHHANASEIIGKEDFDLIYLDLCGSMSKELFMCLDNAKLKPGGILIITLLKGREHPKFHHYLSHGRIQAYERILQPRGFYLYKTITYMDTSPMIVLFASMTPVKEIEIYQV